MRETPSGNRASSLVTLSMQAPGGQIDAEASVGKAPADFAVGRGANEHALAVPDIARRRLVGAIVAIDGDVVRQETTQGEPERTSMLTASVRGAS